MRQTLITVSPALSVSLLATAWAAGDCNRLPQQHDELLRQAHQAEIGLVQQVRRQLCPRLQQRAEDLQATPSAPASEQPMDYDGYRQCRERAERALASQQPVLYRNDQGLPYYTAVGARLAREAAELERAMPLACRGISADANHPAVTP